MATRQQTRIAGQADQRDGSFEMVLENREASASTLQTELAGRWPT